MDELVGFDLAESRSEPESSAGTPNWELFKLYVELYKHHFDLFVKGYVVYLAIIGATAGFVFRAEVEPVTRTGLLWLATLISILATAAWFVSFLWAHSFSREVLRLCRVLNVPAVPTFGVKIIIALGTVGSTAMVIGGFLLLRL